MIEYQWEMLETLGIDKVCCHPKADISTEMAIPRAEPSTHSISIR